MAVAVGPLLLFGPMLLRGEALFWGAPMLQFTPWRTAALRILSSGHWPLWNPWLGMGAPLLANYQSALLYPPNLLLLVVDVAWGQTLLVMLHLMWAGAGMLCLARRIGLGRLGQWVASLSFALCAYLVARAGFLSMNATSAWLPWVLWAVEGLGRSQNSPATRRAAIAILAAILSMQWLAGHAQLAWYSAFLAGAWCMWRGGEERGWRGALGGAGRFLAAAGLAALLAAAQLIPTLEYLSQSGRAQGLAEGFALTYSLWPWRLLGLLAPDLFGHPAQGNFWGYANYWEDALFMGVLPLLLALGAAAGRGGPHRGLRLFLTAAGGSSLLLALGDHLPLFPFLFRQVPTFDLFQAPTRWTLIMAAALALLAGLGADRWSAPGPRATYWLRLGTVGAGTVVLAAWLGPQLIPDLEPTLAPAIARSGLLLGLTGVLALRRPNSASLGWDAAALGLILVDLAFAGFSLNPSRPLSLQRGHTPLASRLADGHRLYMPAELEQDLKFIQHFRFDSYQPGHDWPQVRLAGLPNTTLLDGLPSANNFDPLLTGRFEALLEALQRAAPSKRSEILDLMDVGWEARADPTAASGVQYTLREGAHRARLVTTAQWVEGPEEALGALLGAGHDPTRTVLLEGTPDPRNGEPGSSGEIQIVDPEDPGRVELLVEAPGGGWAVLHDAWYPGWRATLDGQAVPIHVADGIFRAVWIPAGHHTLVFSYAPRSFAAGAVISLTGWAGLLALVWLRRGRRSDGQP
jgi:hypothetical protein